jgi:hypothetical protein
MADADIERLALGLEPHRATQASAFPDHDISAVFVVIARSEADEAIQFSVSCGRMDCFAEPVIGRAIARPVGSQ